MLTSHTNTDTEPNDSKPLPPRVDVPKIKTSHIDLKNSNLQSTPPEELEQQFSAFAHTTESLDLSENDFSDCPGLLSRALWKTAHLRPVLNTLNLKANNLALYASSLEGYTGNDTRTYVRSILRELSCFDHLKTLDLSLNYLSNYRKFAKRLLLFKSNLTTLDLSHNGFDFDGVKQVIRALPAGLTTLFLKGHNLQLLSKDKLKELFQDAKPGLQFVHLSDTDYIDLFQLRSTPGMLSENKQEAETNREEQLIKQIEFQYGQGVDALWESGASIHEQNKAMAELIALKESALNKAKDLKNSQPVTTQLQQFVMQWRSKSVADAPPKPQEKKTAVGKAAPIAISNFWGALASTFSTVSKPPGTPSPEVGVSLAEATPRGSSGRNRGRGRDGK